MRISTKIQCDTEQLLSFMLPGLRLAAQLIAEQIEQIEAMTQAPQPQAPQSTKSLAAKPTGFGFSCSECGAVLKNARCRRVHERIQHGIYVAKRSKARRRKAS